MMWPIQRPSPSWLTGSYGCQGTSKSCWGPETAPSELGIKRAWEQRDPTFPEASGKQHKTTHDNLPFQRRQGCTEPMAGHSGHHRPQDCATELWERYQYSQRPFFARFETQNTCPQKTSLPSPDKPPSAASVTRTLPLINTQKAAGPDDIPGSVLKDCAEEPKYVFTDIFKTSPKQAIVPSCFKAATITSVTKKSSTSCFNDYRPMALALLMKCFEGLVIFLCSSPSSHSPGQDRHICTNAVRRLQFSFHHHNTTATHLQTGPQHLPSATGCWTSSASSSSSITLSIEAPQGCMLSPLLFTLLTHDCTPSYSSNNLVKFVDDTTLVGLITKGGETHYRKAVDLLTLFTVYCWNPSHITFLSCLLDRLILVPEKHIGLKLLALYYLRVEDMFLFCTCALYCLNACLRKG